MKQRLLAFLEFVPSVLLLFMAILTSVSVASRYLFAYPLPDEYEISRLILSVVVCWGIAAAFRHNDHIQLDIFWSALGPRAKRVLTRIGAALCLCIIGGFSFALGTKVIDVFEAGLLTVDLELPVWGFYTAAWLGTLASFFILLQQVIAPSEPEAHDGHPDATV